MAAQSWDVTVKAETERGTEQHCVFAPNPTNAQTQLERRGYTILEVSPGHFFKNVNASAEFKNL